jgi:thiol-disulfide isomerase/thioredoxin
MVLLSPGLVLAAAIAAAPADDLTILNIGDAPPAVKVGKWVKGEPVEAFPKGKVHVVEFWATWCGPCRQTIPHLTELAHTYRGKVTFAGISVEGPEETAGENLETVEKFVKKMGDKMDYSVAVDTGDETMAKTWLRAAGERGIPLAFIIGSDGRIAWIGHPTEDEFDTVLAKIVKGEYDVKGKAEARLKLKGDEVFQERLAVKLADLAKADKFKEALEALDAGLKKHPDMETMFGAFRFKMLLRVDAAAASALGRKLADGDYKDEPEALYRMTRDILVFGPKLDKPDYDLAVTLASRANELTKSEEPMILAALAESYARKGMPTKAVEWQKKAVELVEKDPDANAEVRKNFREKLAEYAKAAG